VSGFDWSRHKVAVTGAGGFIGSHLAERLVELGAETRALVHYTGSGRQGWLDESPLRRDMRIISGDVRDPGSLRDLLADVDVVFHLAALIGIPYSYRSPESYVQTNVVGTLNILEAARHLGIQQVVHTSTSEVYGSGRVFPMTEAHPLQAQSPYAASKIGADKLAEAYACSFDLSVVTIRPFNTFGPRQSARAVIPNIITQALTGQSIRLGTTATRRDFNFVADTVSGFVKAAESIAARGQVINLGTGRDVSICDLVNMIQVILGTEAPIAIETERVRPSGSEVDRLCADPSSATQLLGWQPEHSLETGLRLTADWIRQNPQHYRPELYAV
jgi:NAD dependent epimerase/dehydratase